MPKLQNRRLRIHPSKPGLYYSYNKCDEGFFKNNCNRKEDFYDLNNSVHRMNLRAMGFTCISERRWK